MDQPVEDVETLEPVEIEQADASEGEADEVRMLASLRPLPSTDLVRIGLDSGTGWRWNRLQQNAQSTDLQSQLADLQTSVAVLNQATAPLAQLQQEMIRSKVIKFGWLKSPAVQSTSDTSPNSYRYW